MLDFGWEALLEETVSVAMATYGALSVETLRDMPWPDYERALEVVQRHLRKREPDGGSGQ